MKKYIFITILFSSIIVNAIQAQNLIARQSGSTTTFHTTLDDAITNANNDDILYIPGGYFDLTVPITKKIHIYGEGHNPNYSVANGTTIIGGQVFNLSPEANGSTFQGLYINCVIALQEQCKNISFFRCSIHAVSYEGVNASFRENIALTECIVRSDMNCLIQYGEFNNCIFQGHFFTHYRNCGFRNCIFLNTYFPWTHPNYVPGYALYIDFSRFDKCIFLASGIGNAGLCYFYDNIFNGPEGNVDLDGTNLIGNNNRFMPQEMIFEDQSGNAFLYEHNYHLKNEPTDVNLIIGIHGGPSPWKENCFPMNPQILEKNISTYTNPDGTLDVNIKVEAQQK